jgi:3-hydroxyacyl-CoA dehydrogenase
MEADAATTVDDRRPPELIVAVIGAGSIGAAFALVFAAAGCQVRLYDPDADRRKAALPTIAARLGDLAGFGLAAEPVDATLARVGVVADAREALEGATFVQECAPEDLDLKRALFAELDAATAPKAILASASSAIPATQFANGLAGRARCLVVHPGNPPYLIRIAEVVPADFTDDGVVMRTVRFLEHCGVAPVVLRREIEGFVFNRLQGALLREAYCLVRDGIAGVEDIDRLVRDGLGLRWSVIGPFETADLNVRGGVAAHAERMGPAYQRMGAERGQNDPWTPDLVARVAAERRKLLPLEAWEERVAWRDRALMRLLGARRAAREPA